MNVFITGATGFVGSHVADYFAAQGFNVFCNVRKSSDLSWVNNKGYKLIEASLSDKLSLDSAVKNMDYVVHIAGVVAAKNYDEYLKANLHGTMNLANACLNSNPNLKRFLHVSSQTASGPAKSYEHPTTEKDEMNPITAYGRSKKESELALHKIMDKLPITIVRPPAVYGPRDKAIMSVFQAVNMGIGTLIGSDTKYVSLVHVHDLARGIYLATLNEKAINQTYYISSEEFYNWNQLIDIMKTAFNKKTVVKLKLPHPLVMTLGNISELVGKAFGTVPVFNHDKAIDFIQKYWICSPEKAVRELNYKQEVRIEEGIESTFRWYKENNWL